MTNKNIHYTCRYWHSFFARAK